MSDSIPLNFQVTNSNAINAGTIPARISQVFNTPITNSLSEYDIHLLSLTSSTTLPIYNIKKYIDWTSPSYPPGTVGHTYTTNFVANRTNMTFTIVSTTGIFSEALIIANPFLFPVGTASGVAPNVVYPGCGCYLQYISENTGGQYVNPAYNVAYQDVSTPSSIGYPDEYFNVHSVQQHVDMINIAIMRIMNSILGGRDPQFNPYFSVEQSGLISLNVVASQNFSCDGTTTPAGNVMITSIISTFSFYCNDYCIKALDGFRTASMGATVMNASTFTGLLNTADPLSTVQITCPSNGGMDNLFMFNQVTLDILNPPAIPYVNYTLNNNLQYKTFIYNKLVPNPPNPSVKTPILNNYTNPAGGVTANPVSPQQQLLYYVITAEYNAISNIFDTQSILIVAENDCLKKINPTFIGGKPPTSSSSTSQQMTQISCLKALDLDYTNITIQSINNAYIQYQSSVLDRPLVFSDDLKNLPFDGVTISIQSLDFDNTIRPINLACFGHFNIKFLMKHKQTKMESVYVKKIK